MLTLPFEGLATNLRTIDNGHCCAAWVCNPEYAVRMLFGLKSSQRNSAPCVVVIGRRAHNALESLSVAIPFNAEDLESWNVFLFKQADDSNKIRYFPIAENLLEAFPEPSDLVFLSFIDDFPPLKGEQISRTLNTFDTAVHNGNHSALLLFIGSPELTSFERQLRDFRHLDGLASLYEKQWHAYYWRNGYSITGDYRRAIEPMANKSGFKVSPVIEWNCYSNDEDRIICAHLPMASQKPALPALEMVADNETLFKKGMTTSSATLLFSVRSNEEIESVARWIYELRSTQGPNLKIFAVLASPAIRRYGMLLLHSCGANLVFEYTASPAYVRIVMSLLAHESFNRVIPESFDKVEAHFKAMSPQGPIAPELFFKTVASYIASTMDAQGSHGALLVLKPSGDLTAREVAGAFHPERSGDICCVIGSRLVVFLADCMPEYLSLAFSRIFTAPADRLFSSYIDAYEDHLILDALVDLQSGTAPSSSGVEHQVKSGKIPVDGEASPSDKPCRIPAGKPRRISLSEVMK